MPQVRRPEFTLPHCQRAQGAGPPPEFMPDAGALLCVRSLRAMCTRNAGRGAAGGVTDTRGNTENLEMLSSIKYWNCRVRLSLPLSQSNMTLWAAVTALLKTTCLQSTCRHGLTSPSRIPRTLR